MTVYCISIRQLKQKKSIEVIDQSNVYIFNDNFSSSHSPYIDGKAYRFPMYFSIKMRKEKALLNFQVYYYKLVFSDGYLLHKFPAAEFIFNAHLTMFAFRLFTYLLILESVSVANK